MVIAGDLYDRSVPSAEAVELVDDIFTEITTELDIPILAISGNHDSRQRLSFAGKLLQKQKLFLIGTLQRNIQKVTLCDDVGLVNFYLLPFFQPADIRPLFSRMCLQNTTGSLQHHLKRNSRYAESE